jgi:hypothetical protein
MARNLSTELPFLIITNVESHPLLRSYHIMNATVISPTECIDFSKYGTIICFSMSDEYFSIVANQCSSRFFGILLREESFEIVPKSKYCQGAKLESAYIGIPTAHSKETCPDGFWEVTYPHITIVPPNHKIHNYAGMLHEYEYSYSELISTENTYTHHVLIGEEPHHITRMVRDGMKPVIAGKEIVSGTHYTTCVGHAVIM